MVRRNFFIIGLISFVFIYSLLTPSVSTLLQPDSFGYINFSNVRTSFYPVFLDIAGYFGVSIEQIPILQVFIFSLSLYYLLITLSSVFKSRLFLFTYVVILMGNVWLVSMHKTILTESIYISLNIMAISSLINFLHYGSTKYILMFSFMLGISMGVRPSGVAMISILPIILLVAYNKFRKIKWSWIVALVVPIIFTQIIESSLYRSYHGSSNRGSILPVIVFGKGAMIKGDFKFNGPNSKVLDEFSKEIDLEFFKVHEFINEIPYFWLKNQSIPNYEIYAQMKLLKDRRHYYAEKAKTSVDNLIMELGKQRLLQGVDQWLINAMHHYAASWSLRVTTFPLFVKKYNDWALNKSYIPFNQKIEYLPLKGDKIPSLISAVVFPGLLIAGILTFVIGLVFIVMLVLKMDIQFSFMLSGLFSVWTHGMLIFYSIVNVATPRYTTSLFPVLLLALMMFFLFILNMIKIKNGS
ncbi:hypothetical protein HOB87_10160 [Candidatus Woesearchaeota archaeon]|jgi:hypothetical protein|nr:hypothetical protein [Candidatus Woesearchaeota archaeon]